MCLLCSCFNRQKYVSGIYLLGSAEKLKSGSEEASVYAACKFSGPKAIYPFAFRTHAHSLGKCVCVLGGGGGGGIEESWYVYLVVCR